MKLQGQGFDSATGREMENTFVNVKKFSRQNVTCENLKVVFFQQLHRNKHDSLMKMPATYPKKREGDDVKFIHII